jgi:hypothetical protein
VVLDANKTEKNNFWKKSNYISKNAEFYADFKTVEKMQKMHTKKVVNKNVM